MLSGKSAFEATFWRERNEKISASFCTFCRQIFLSSEKEVEFRKGGRGCHKYWWFVCFFKLEPDEINSCNPEIMHKPAN